MSELTIPQTLSALTNNVRAGVPFLHVRYGDGECIAMFENPNPKAVNGDGHNYPPDMCLEMKEEFDWAVDQLAFGRRDIYLGTHHNTLHEALKWFKGYNLDSLTTVPADFWAVPGEAHDGPEMLGLLMAIRGWNGPAVLVGKQTISRARHCLNTDHIVIPETNAWLARSVIEEYCADYMRRVSAAQGPLFVWCCGYLGKILAPKLFRENHYSAHLDFGHFFDAVLELPTRKWIQEMIDGEWVEPVKGVQQRRVDYLRNVIQPYVIGFSDPSIKTTDTAESLV